MMMGTRRTWVPSGTRLFLKSEREGFAHFVTHECKQGRFLFSDVQQKNSL